LTHNNSVSFKLIFDDIGISAKKTPANAGVFCTYQSLEFHCEFKTPAFWRLDKTALEQGSG
jgi:hypothetical protein